MKQFGWLYTLLTHIPQTLVSIIHPLTKDLFDVQNAITAQIQQIRRANTDTSSSKPPQKNDAPPTILHDLLQASSSSTKPLPSSELTTPRLTDEAFTLLGAGTVTTSHTLSTTLYHLLAHPAKHARLRAALAPLYTTTQEPPTWTQLERLPYLSAVLAEGLRLSYGVSHRLPRIAPDTALRVPGCEGGVIPRGTPVSMTQMFLHDDAGIFEEPARFWPERWLVDDEDDRAGCAGREGESEEEREERIARMRRFLVPFSRGTRQCVGMNLAYAENYLTLGALLAPGLGLELWETERKDVDVAHDFFSPAPWGGSRGVRVVVRKEEMDGRMIGKEA